MSQPNPLELAKQGNPKAIAFLINRPLQSKGVIAMASLKDDCLQVLLESVEIPDQQTLAPYVLKGVTGLGVASINRLRVYGRKQGETKPVWSQEFELFKRDTTQPSSPKQLTPVSEAKVEDEKTEDKDVVPPVAKPPVNVWVSCLSVLILLGLTGGLIYIIGVGSVYLLGSLFGSNQSSNSVPNTSAVETPLTTEDAQKTLTDFPLKAATWNAELAAYKTMLRESKANSKIKDRQLGILVASAMYTSLAKETKVVRDQAMKNAASEVAKTLKLAQTGDTEATANRINSRHKQAVKECGIFITQTLD